MRYKEIITPSSIEEAYKVLTSGKTVKMIGGGLFIRLQPSSVDTGLDLSCLGLDYIVKEEGYVRIGAMASLRCIETSDHSPKALREAVRQISGVGTRNVATIGGSVCGNFSFSDVSTALLSLGAKLRFHFAGEIPIKSFIDSSSPKNDILLEIVVPDSRFSSCRFIKRTYTDFSTINVALTVGNDGVANVAIGARPHRAVEHVYGGNVDEIIEGTQFKSDFRASAQYRRAMAKHLLSEMVKEARL